MGRRTIGRLHPAAAPSGCVVLSGSDRRHDMLERCIVGRDSAWLPLRSLPLRDPRDPWREKEVLAPDMVPDGQTQTIREIVGQERRPT